MRNKGILSLVAVGLFASSLSASVVKAEGNENGLARKAIEHQVEKPLPKGLVDSKTFNQLEKEVKGSQSKSGKGYSKMSDDDYIFEVEYNNDFASADNSSYEKATIGRLLPLYDVDFSKVVVPSDGFLLVAGTASSYAIDLGFAAVQKDYVENSNLKYLGSEYEDGVEYRGYDVKKGTYYVGVYDRDNEYDIDNNTSDDMYAIATRFVDDVKPSKPTVYKVDNNDKVVTGKAEASSTVTVKNGSKVLGSAKATSKGTFSIKIAVQKAGTKLTITAKDSAGNVSSSASVTVVDVIAPSKPTVNKVDNNDKVVTGKAEVNSTVTVKSGSKVLGSAKSTSKGTFSVKIAAQKAGTKLSIMAKDSSGNVSSSTTVTVVDVIAPNKPTVNKVDDNDKVVTGKAEANSTVTVKSGSKMLGSAKASSKGSYSVKIKTQKKGTTLSITTKDKAGNTSSKATTKVVKH
ncbi:Ig-like domain-containing protein [Peribacillus frigoritolerans]|uniref:Ig-like domain-containing protein n=1 Tax=Peribacillus frigoritolerans TaxID=450367 RepID=UPI002B24CFA5|nr:Ig-like domain-containing protein [Peribacillus frigoritolerans]MEB2630171.1 Ig-like domain-containing protein [Peribacillus frigoritolerans]